MRFVQETERSWWEYFIDLGWVGKSFEWWKKLAWLLISSEHKANFIPKKQTLIHIEKAQNHLCSVNLSSSSTKQEILTDRIDSGMFARHKE